MFTKFEHLRKNKIGNQPLWTDNQLGAGFKYYFQLHGRYPAAGEIDSFDYLPSARSIQRTHGGLINLRKRLFPNEESDHTRGELRRKKASEGDRRASLYEEEFYNYLLDHFEEIAIHEHKVIRPGNVASDVFIYLDKFSKGGIVIDLFYAQDLVTLLKIVNIKLKRYATLPYDVYFILVGNPKISNFDINRRIENRHIPLPTHITVMTGQSFKDTVINAVKEKSNYTKKD
jgi:hypothetical protein